MELLAAHLLKGVGKKVGPRLREFFRQFEAEVVSNSRTKIHQTWDPLFSPPLYMNKKILFIHKYSLPQCRKPKFVSEVLKKSDQNKRNIDIF